MLVLTEEERKSVLLEQLRTGVIKKLVLPVPTCSDDVEFHSEFCHLLHTNTSVSELHIQKKQLSSSPTEMTETDWALLLPSFPVIAEHITRLTVSSTDPVFLVPTLLWNFRNLEHLALDGVTGLRGAEWKSLASALWKHPSLQSFVFRQSESSGHPVSNNDSVVEALATAPKLKKFCQEGPPGRSSSSNDKSTQEGDCYYVHLLPSSLAHLLGTGRLEYVRYAHLGFYRQDGGVDDSVVAELAQKVLLSGVKTLSLANNGMEPSSLAMMLNVGVLDNLSLVELDLSYTTTIDSQDNAAVVDALTSVLYSNHTLQDLNLSFCRLSDETMVQIAQSLLSNSTLRRLNLDGNEILQLSTLTAFAAALLQNRTLELLDLDVHENKVTAMNCGSDPHCTQFFLDQIESRLLRNAAGRNQITFKQKEALETLY